MCPHFTVPASGFESLANQTTNEGLFHIRPVALLRQVAECRGSRDHRLMLIRTLATGLGMSAVQGAHRFQEIALKWHDLAERRLEYYSELYRSGRWTRYYQSQEQFAERMLDVIRAARDWARLAGREPASAAGKAAALHDDLRNAA